MKHYEHTQPGTVMRVSMGIATVAFGTIGLVILLKGRNPEVAIGPLAVPLITMVCLALFHSLTVRVNAEAVSFAFGVGLIRKTIPFSDIESAATVRNHWYNGWGIKLIRGGWLYNVAGLDAVELTHKNGKKTRIGTDEPKKLLAAIEAGLERSAG